MDDVKQPPPPPIPGHGSLKSVPLSAAFVLVHKSGATGRGGYEVMTGAAAHDRAGEFDMWLEFGSKEDAEREREHYVSQTTPETLQGPQAPHSRQRQLRARLPKAQRRP